MPTNCIFLTLGGGGRRRGGGSFFTLANNSPMEWKGSRDVCGRRGSWRRPLSVI